MKSKDLKLLLFVKSQFKWLYTESVVFHDDIWSSFQRHRWWYSNHSSPSTKMSFFVVSGKRLSYFGQYAFRNERMPVSFCLVTTYTTSSSRCSAILSVFLLPGLFSSWQELSNVLAILFNVINCESAYTAFTSQTTKRRIRFMTV